MISQEKKELVIQLFKEGNRPYHIHKQTLISSKPEFIKNGITPASSPHRSTFYRE